MPTGELNLEVCAKYEADVTIHGLVVHWLPLILPQIIKPDWEQNMACAMCSYPFRHRRLFNIKAQRQTWLHQKCLNLSITTTTNATVLRSFVRDYEGESVP